MRRRHGRGQSLVEMALIAPILVTMLLAVIDFGRAAYDYATLSAAAREGARAAIVTGTSKPDNSRVIAAVEKYAVGVALGPGACVNDPAPATPVIAANTGLVYVGAGNGNTTPNAPGGQPSAGGGTCGAVVPSFAGRNPLQVTIQYNFQPLTPFASQFFPGGIVMTVSSTMNTEF